MRIALVTEVFLPAVDGVVTRLTRTLEAQQRRGDEVLVIAPAGCPPMYAGARVVGMPALPLVLYPDGVGYPEKRVSLPWPALRRVLRAFRPELIHAVNPVLLAAGAVHHARRERVPLVASYHANLPAYARLYGLGALEGAGWRYLRATHNHADLNLCTSAAALHTLEEHGVRRLRLWPYGVSYERPDGACVASWRARLSGGRAERVVLLYVGRLAREKQVDHLRPLVHELDGVALAIVGDGPLRRELEREFAGTPTTFTGLLSGSELASAYACADIFVFPSVTETLGLVVLEAHAAGLPVLTPATAVGRELVRDGIDGLLYEPGDVDSLVAAARLLAEDPMLRATMAEHARRSVQGVGWERATQVLCEHYESAVEAHRRRVAPPRRAMRAIRARERRRSSG